MRVEVEAFRRSLAKMRSPTAIRTRIKEIDRDERYHYKPALVQVNAPLALIQVEMQAEIEALAWVLNEKAPKPGPRKKPRRRK